MDFDESSNSRNLSGVIRPVATLYKVSCVFRRGRCVAVSCFNHHCRQRRVQVLRGEAVDDSRRVTCVCFGLLGRVEMPCCLPLRSFFQRASLQFVGLAKVDGVAAHAESWTTTRCEFHTLITGVIVVRGS